MQAVKAFYSNKQYKALMAALTELYFTPTQTLELAEWHIYGSSRLGIYKADKGLALVEDETITEIEYQTHVKIRYNGKKQYELSNHLGNVLVTISDRRTAICNDSNETEGYESVVVTASDYYAFGSPLIGRGWEADSVGGYRFGFNGKENDDECETQDYGLRIYNPGIGRFLSRDPLSDEFPWNSPFSFAENNVINAIDIEGAEKYLAIEYTLKNSLGRTFTYKVDYRLVHNGTENAASRNARFNNNPGIIAVVQRLQYNSHSIESGKQTLRMQSNTLASNTLLASQFSNIGANSNYMLGLDAGNLGNQDSKKIMSATVFKAPTVFFDNDKGLTNDDFYKELGQSTTLRNDIDNMAKILVADPNYKLEVYGYASSKATDINGSKSSVSAENNNELAGMRAEAAKTFLIQYVKDHYCTDVDPNRITPVNGRILGTTDESKARKVVFVNKL